MRSGCCGNKMKNVLHQAIPKLINDNVYLRTISSEQQFTILNDGFELFMGMILSTTFTTDRLSELFLNQKDSYILQSVMFRHHLHIACIWTSVSSPWVGVLDIFHCCDVSIPPNPVEQDLHCHSTCSNVISCMSIVHRYSTCATKRYEGLYNQCIINDIVKYYTQGDVQVHIVIHFPYWQMIYTYLVFVSVSCLSMYCFSKESVL